MKIHNTTTIILVMGFIFLIGIVIGYSMDDTCEVTVYEEIKFHGGLRFVDYENGNCYWNNTEIDCLKAEQYINKNPEGE